MKRSGVTESFAEGGGRSQVKQNREKRGIGLEAHIQNTENSDQVPLMVNFQPLKEASFTYTPHQQSKDTAILCFPHIVLSLLKLCGL